MAIGRPNTKTVIWVAWTLLLSFQAAWADIVPPVNLQMKEVDTASVLVQWKVPVQIPVEATPRPVLPEQCVSKDDQAVVEQPGGRVYTESFRCEGGLGGAEIGIRFPFYNATFSTLTRVELRSGEQFVHVLEPGDTIWVLPEGSTGLRQDPWTNLKRGVVAGIDHFSSSWIHWTLALSLCLIGGPQSAVRLVTAFAAGQLGAIALNVVAGLSIDGTLAEVGVLLTVVLLAAHALKPVETRSGMLSLLFVGGLTHGLALASMVPPPPSFDGVEWLYFGLAVLGMDALLLVTSIVMSAVGSQFSRFSWTTFTAKALAYGLGGIGVAAALGLIVMSPTEEAEARPPGVGLPSLSLGQGGASSPGSRALAPQGLQDPIQTFLTIDPFETRLETLVRLRDVAERIGLAEDEVLEIDDQGEVQAAVLGLVTPAVEVSIDEISVEPVVDRVDFLEVGTQGVLPRQDPIRESVSGAHLGVTLSYLTAEMPEEIRLLWSSFSRDDESVPATVTDPESSRSVRLSADDPELVWINELLEDPVPTVESVAVEPKSYVLPMFSIPIFLVSLYFIIAALRGRRRTMNFAWSRVSLTVALLVAPNGRLNVEFDGSSSSTPSSDQAKSILVSMLPNIYRAFEFREESVVYDRLAINVTGETLSDIYLEHRRALELEERGGARARVEAVEVPEVRSVEPQGEGAFDADATWLVGGTVTHFGHRHFRQNRYDARVSLVPIDGVWKISEIEIFDEERVK
jgi:hypothetical protein